MLLLSYKCASNGWSLVSVFPNGHGHVEGYIRISYLWTGKRGISHAGTLLDFAGHPIYWVEAVVWHTFVERIGQDLVDSWSKILQWTWWILVRWSLSHLQKNSQLGHQPTRAASCRKCGFVQEWGIHGVYRRSTAEFSPFFQKNWFLIAITQGISGECWNAMECPIFTPYRFNRKPWTCSNAAAMRMSSAQLQGAGKKGGCERVEGSLWVLRDDDVV